MKFLEYIGIAVTLILIICIAEIAEPIFKDRRSAEMYQYVVDTQIKVCVDTIPNLTYDDCEDMFKASFLKGYMKTHDKIPDGFDEYMDKLSARQANK